MSNVADALIQGCMNPFVLIVGPFCIGYLMLWGVASFRDWLMMRRLFGPNAEWRRVSRK